MNEGVNARRSSRQKFQPSRRWRFGAAVIAGGALLTCSAVLAGRGGAAGSGGGPILNTTSEDFFQPGTQPLGGGLDPLAPIVTAFQCQICHGNYEPDVAPHTTWSASMMAQSARDPVFQAALMVANNDAGSAGEFCIRCHVPTAFLEGRHDPPDGSMFNEVDLEGIACNFCHRAVDPEFKPGVSPPSDEMILTDLEGAGFLPIEPGNAQYVIDPIDNRRGPRDDIKENVHLGFPQPEIIHSPFHRAAEFCWNCHDVSNPLLNHDHETGLYSLGDLDAAHPTSWQRDMFPLHRTYSEWKNSYYSTVGVQHNGRFGGNHPTGVMRDCQDCHMPMIEGAACNIGGIDRPDVAQHFFMGSNTWVLRAVRELYDDGATGLTEELVDQAIERNIDFLQKASDLELSLSGDQLRVRIINRTGHKLPTGFPDGRRIWINVKFFDDAELIEEYGAYDFEEAALDEANTKVYEAVLGIDAEQAAATGLPEGPTFHFMLANTMVKDNRIPPTGWFRSIAEERQTLPVGANYSSGQHWDDTHFDIPPGARHAVVSIYYQVTTREFIEYLRDHDPSKDGLGQIAYDQWVAQGKSQPVVMDMAQFVLCPEEDLNCDGVVNVLDLLELLSAWGLCEDPPAACPQDVNNDGVVNVLDLLALLAAWS